MGKKSLKQILATLLAASMLAPTAAALSEQENATPANPSTTIEAEVTAPSIEDLCLTEEFIAFLNQNNIKIVDGNIIIETAEQFGLIAQYFLDYLKSKGVETTFRDVCDHILALNHAFISDNVKRELLKKNMITYPLLDYQKIKGLYKTLREHLRDISAKETSKGFCSNTYIMFDYKIRKCIALEEAYFINFLDEKDVGKSKKAPQYVLDFLDFYNFLVGEESTFPYKFSELDKSASHIFLLINLCEQSAASRNPKLPLVQILNYAADEKVIETAYDSIYSCIQSFPIEDEKVATIGK